MKIQLLALSMLAVIAGCTQTEQATMKPADPKAAYEAALADTQAAVDKAASVGGEWRDIRWEKADKPLLPTAQKEAAAGNYEEAMKLLAEAKFQAEAGYKQATEQKNPGPRF